MPTQRLVAAWSVHIYTILGGVVALFALFEMLKGNAQDGFLMLIASRLIDATDGMLARAVKVWEVLPNFSGELVDHLIDIFSYLWLPITVMWHYSLLPHSAWLIAPVLGSLYSYGASTKTNDNFFQGFPSYWGGILLYMYHLQPVAWVAVLMLVVPAFFCFVPIKFLYPTKNPFLRRTSWVLVLAWTALWAYILIAQPENQKTLVYISLFYPLYYLAASGYANIKFR